jgi:release factor glutamine methyltransferase
VTLGEALSRATEELAERGLDTPRVDAELIFAKALGVERLALALDRDRLLSGPELAAARALVDRRARREPLAYVLGEWGFRRLVLRVDRRVLVPRPETEVVVERCLALLRALEEPCVLDVGTGSGAIALALADEHPGARVTATDVSPEALEVARENAEATGLAGRVTLVEADLADGFAADAYDLVVSNPPYVEPGDLETLQPEVRDWEPRTALVGTGETETIACAARTALRNGGWLVLEVGDGQAQTVARLLVGLGYDQVRITPDLTGRERVVEGRRS